MRVYIVQKATHAVCGWHPNHGTGIIGWHDNKKSAKWERDFLNTTGGKTYVQTRDRALDLSMTHRIKNIFKR